MIYVWAGLVQFRGQVYGQESGAEDDLVDEATVVTASALTEHKDSNVRRSVRIFACIHSHYCWKYDVGVVCCVVTMGTAAWALFG